MGEQDLRQWFSAIDSNRSGSLDATELQRALALGNLHFSLLACARIIRVHDSDGNGTVSFEEFRSLHKFLVDIQQTFQQADSSRRGRLDKQTVERLLQNQGYRLDAPAFSALFNAYNPERNGSLDLTELIGITLFLQSARATFVAFDQQKQGRISLDWNQFVYGAANVV